jgi:ClpP class serine protease
VLDILWLFLIVLAIQPVIKQRYLEASRQRLIAKIERQRGSRVILLVHREETMSLLGFPVLRYIDINDSEQVLRAIHLTDPDVPIDLILHTPGGLVLAALQIARAIDRHKGWVTAFVPHYAMSGGTLIALAADEIVLCEHAVLGPVDPQLGEFPAASLLRVIRDKPIAEVDDKTLVLADQAEKAFAQLRQAVQSLLGPKLGSERAGELAGTLTEGTWTHDYPITFDVARQLGLPVSPDMPEEIMELVGAVPPARPAGAERRVSVGAPLSRSHYAPARGGRARVSVASGQSCGPAHGGLGWQSPRDAARRLRGDLLSDGRARFTRRGLVHPSEPEDPHRQQHHEDDDRQDDPGIPWHALEAGGDVVPDILADLSDPLADRIEGRRAHVGRGAQHLAPPAIAQGHGVRDDRGQQRDGDEQ